VGGRMPPRYVITHLSFRQYLSVHIVSSVTVVTGLGAGRRKNRGSIPGGGKKFFASETCRLAMGPTNAHTQRVPGDEASQCPPTLI
jgi:hypothetical protein